MTDINEILDGVENVGLTDREKKNLYQRNYRRNNLDKFREYQKTYYERHYSCRRFRNQALSDHKCNFKTDAACVR